MGFAFSLGLGEKPTPNPNTVPATALLDEDDNPLRDEDGNLLEED